ncbi:MAG: Fic family protein [Actinobacteria bacterium]|nr:Fic family protein [Actinomycetota bacterium]
MVSEAANEIARFDAELGSELGPFGSILLRSESAASSKIENLSATAQSIFLAELGDPSRRNASIIVANTTAMQAALRLADRIDAGAILAMHEALLSASQPQLAGRWRDQQVWIGGNDYSPHDALFVPPHHKRVGAAIDDLLTFIDREDLPPLAHAAIAHAQFETIHPFPDGNGRVGRALVHSILKAKQLTRKVTVPVSAGLLADLPSYFAALTEYRAGDHEPIVRMTADATFRAIGNGRTLVQDLHQIHDEWRGEVVARKDAAVWRLAELALRQPVLDSEIVQRELGVAPHNANTALALLEDIGALKKISGNHRYRKWAAKDVLDALDRFAERAGRRQPPPS